MNNYIVAFLMYENDMYSLLFALRRQNLIVNIGLFGSFGSGKVVKVVKSKILGNALEDCNIYILKRIRGI